MAWFFILGLYIIFHIQSSDLLLFIGDVVRPFDSIVGYKIKPIILLGYLNPVAREVWSRLLKHLSLPFSWCRDTLSDCIQMWITLQISSSQSGSTCLLESVVREEQGYF
jgi:hypothetical protein